MYNMATDAPPEAVMVNGGVYSINTDFRIWIEIMDVFMFKSDDTEELVRCVKMAFLEPERVMTEQDPESVLRAMSEFLNGYPKENIECDEYSAQSNESVDADDGISRERYYDFKYDLNWIIIAIRNQSGIDLSYRCKHFHWWLFLLEFESLEDRHYFSAIRRIREYKGNDKQMIAMKKRYALPIRHTAEERKQLEEFNKFFS